MKKTVRAVGGTFIGIEKNRGGYTQHAKRKRHCNGKHKTTINHSVGSKRFRPVSEQSTRSESQIRRKKMAHFFGSRSFLPAAKTPLSFFAPKPNEKGWLRRLYQSRNVKVEIYKFAVINVHFRISRLFFGSICRRVTVYDYTLKNFNINYGLCLS